MTAHAAAQIAVAVDWGGTKLAVGLVAEDGRVIAWEGEPTPSGGPTAVATRSRALTERLLQQTGISRKQLCGLGATVPGVADTKNGILKFAPAHGLVDIPFASILSDEYALPARIVNDVNACATAEHRFGIAVGSTNFVWITLSTGIGAGIFLNGRLFEGTYGLAGEIGHVPIREEGALCGCGHRGCLESEASGRAIARNARTQGLVVSEAKDVVQLAEGGNEIAQRVLHDAVKVVGRAVACLVNILDPELVVYGGGIASALDPQAIESVARKQVVMDDRRFPRMALTSLGRHAPLIGAALLVFPHNHED